MKLREAREVDIDSLAEIAAASYRADFADILEQDAMDERDVAFFTAKFRGVLEGVRVAESDGRIVGFSQIVGSHLVMLFVAPGSQGQGAGTALLRRAEEEGILTLESFRDNLAARAFYERRGWRLDRAYEREFVGRVRSFVLYTKS